MAAPEDFQPAWLLHARPQGETSVLAWFFTLEEGRVNAVVRGARQPKSRYRALLQPFTPIQVRFKTSARSDLKNLLNLETLSAPLSLHGEALFYGLYVNEILSRLLLPNLTAQQVFRDYSVFMQLVNQPEHREPALRRFELSLLDFLGHPISWHDLTGQALQAESYYYWVQEQGCWRLIANPAPRTRAFQGASLLALAQDDWRLTTTLTAARQLNKQLLAPLLGNKPLQSRQLYLNFQALQARNKSTL